MAQTAAELAKELRLAQQESRMNPAAGTPDSVVQQEEAPAPQAPRVQPGPLPEAAPRVDTTDDARAARGFGQSTYQSGLVDAPQIPQQMGVDRSTLAPPAPVAPAPRTSLARNAIGVARDRIANLVGAGLNLGQWNAEREQQVVEQLGAPEGGVLGAFSDWRSRTQERKIERIEQLRPLADQWLRDEGYELRQPDLREAIGWGPENDFEWGKAATYIAEQGPAVMVDALGVLMASPLYAQARGMEVAQDRAANDGRSEVSSSDLAIGLGVAATQVLSEQIGVGYITMKGALGRWFQSSSLGGRIVKGGLREGLSEAGEEVIELEAATAGTENPATWEDRALAAIGGFILGKPMGMITGAVTGGRTADEEVAVQAMDVAPDVSIENDIRSGAIDLPSVPTQMSDMLSTGSPTALAAQLRDAAPVVPQPDLANLGIELDLQGPGVLAEPAQDATPSGLTEVESAPSLMQDAPIGPGVGGGMVADNPPAIMPEIRPVSSGIISPAPVDTQTAVEGLLKSNAISPEQHTAITQIAAAPDLTTEQKVAVAQEIALGKSVEVALADVVFNAAQAPMPQVVQESVVTQAAQSQVDPFAQVPFDQTVSNAEFDAKELAQQLREASIPTEQKAHETVFFMPRFSDVQGFGDVAKLPAPLTEEEVLALESPVGDVDADAEEVTQVMPIVVEKDGRVWRPLGSQTVFRSYPVGEVASISAEEYMRSFGFDSAYYDYMDIPGNDGGMTRVMLGVRTSEVRPAMQQLASVLDTPEKVELALGGGKDLPVLSALRDMKVVKKPTLAQKRKTKLDNTKEDAKRALQQTTIHTLATDFEHINYNILAEYEYSNQTHLVYMNPIVAELWQSPHFRKWIDGNALWWHPLEGRAHYESLSADTAQRMGLLPSVFFHATGATFRNMTYGERSLYLPFSAFDMSNAGKGVGGSDTHLGVYLEEDPQNARQWAELTRSNVSPGKVTLDNSAMFGVFAVTANVKNPKIIDYDGTRTSTLFNSIQGEKAKKEGHDALILRNVADVGVGTQVIVFEPNGQTLKSPFSVAFEPQTNHFLAKIGGKKMDVWPLPEHQVAMMNEELAKVGLEGMVDPRVFPFGSKGKASGLSGKDANGLYLALAYDAQSDHTLQGNIRHEIIHLLKQVGFFKTKQGRLFWNVLERRARKSPLLEEVKKNYDPSDWVEETIARMAEAHANGQLEAEGVFGRALKSVRSFLEALGNWVRRNGWTNAEQALQFIFNGNPYMKNWIEATSNQHTYAMDADIGDVVKLGERLEIDDAGAPAGTDWYPKMASWGLTVLQIAYKNPHLGWLQKYVEYARMWDDSKNKRLMAANHTVGMWNSLGNSGKQQTAVAKVLLAMDRMEYRTEEEVAKGVRRQPTDAERNAMFKQYGLNAEGAKVYYQMRKDFDTMLAKMEEIALLDIDRNVSDEFNRDWQKANVTKEFKELRKAPYFPHARFGQETVKIFDADGKLVYLEAFESERQRDRAWKAMRESLPEGHTIARSRFSQQTMQWQGMPPTLIKSIKKKMQLTEDQKRELDDMLVQALPSMSFKKNWVKRDNIKGYSQDVIRAFANYFQHGANYVSRVEYAPLMQDELKAAEEQIMAAEMVMDANTSKQHKIRDHLAGHLEHLLNPQDEWAWLRNTGFIWHIGYVIKSAVLNLTQTPLVTASHLAATYGDAQALAAMTKVMTRMQRYYRNPDKMHKNPLVQKDLALVKRGTEDNVLDQSFAMELAGLANGSYMKRAMGKTMVGRTTAAFMQGAGWMFQMTEKLNRRIAFMSAAELMRANPISKHAQKIQNQFALEFQQLLDKQWDPVEALAYLAGKDAVERTQFNYSAWARPEIARGGFKSAVFTFFMFTQNMLWYTRYDQGNTRYLLALLATAGLLGLPGAEDLEEIVSAIGTQLFGRYWNAEEEMRKWMRPWLEKNGINADLPMHGISRFGFGLGELGDTLGLPLPSLDLSGSISMGSPLPIVSPAIKAGADIAQMGMIGSTFGESWDRVMGEFTMDAAGPAFGIPLSLMEAITNARNPEQAIQKGGPAALRWLTKAYVWSRDGQESRGSGGGAHVVYDRNNPEHWMELGAIALGFNTTRRQQAWDEAIAIGEADRYWTARTGAPKQNFYEALRTGDAEDLADAMQSIADFNETVPYPQLRITADTLRNGFNASQRWVRLTESRTPNAGAHSEIARELRDLYPGELPPESETPNMPTAMYKDGFGEMVDRRLNADLAQHGVAPDDLTIQGLAQALLRMKGQDDPDVDTIVEGLPRGR